MDPSNKYQLRVVSSHDDLNNARLAINADDKLILRSSPAPAPGPAVLVQPASDPSVLIVQRDSSGQTFLTVRGPSGRGPYQLEATTHPEPFGIGALSFYKFWATASNDETQKLLLRQKHDSIDDGHWVAVPQEAGTEPSWEIYWITPRPYNRGDFKDAATIELELVVPE